jgi:hypothetical protein
MRPELVGTLILVTSLLASATADDKEVRKVKAMRKEVLKELFAEEDKSAAVAWAYRKLFTHVGHDGIKKLMEDEDPSIALQAAWELHRKAMKRDPPILIRTDWVFDRKEIEEFLNSFSKRLKTEPPVWWKSTLLKGDVFPGQHHAFIDQEGPLPEKPKVMVDKNNVIFTSGEHTFKAPKAEFEKAGGISARPVILCGEDLSYVAQPSFRGYPFSVMCVDSKTGKKQWEVNVWAARRGPSTGPPGGDSVEVCRHGDRVIVYGCESHGMYAEGFDAKSGKCQFRFCTCYWFNFSEAWGLR